MRSISEAIFTFFSESTRLSPVFYCLCFANVGIVTECITVHSMCMSARLLVVWNIICPFGNFCNNCCLFQGDVFSLVCPTPSVEDQGPFVVHVVWPLPCNQSGMVRPAGLLQSGVVYHQLFSIRPVWRSNTSQSLLGSTWLQIKASHYPTGCCVVISACEAAMCLQAAGHILGGCCTQLRWESVWVSRNVLMEITAEHMIAPTSAVMLGPTSNNFAHARTHAHTQSHTHTYT